MHRCFRVLLFALFVWWGWEGTGYGYWLTSTRAEMLSTQAQVFVEEGEVRLVLEMGKDDAKVFKGMVGGDGGMHALALRTEKDGKPIKGRLTRFGNWKQLRGGAQLSGGSKLGRREFAQYMELVYPVKGKPAELWLKAEGLKGVGLGLIAYHLSLPVCEVRRWGGEERLLLNWEDPWRSRFEGEKWKKYPVTPLLSFLYIEAGEVRHEVITQPRYLGVKAGERREVEERVGALLQEKIVLEVDGKRVEGVVGRKQWVALRRDGIEVLEGDKVKLENGLIGVSLSYPIEQFPKDVKMIWEVFPTEDTEVASVVVDEVGKNLKRLLKGDAVVRWQPKEGVKYAAMGAEMEAESVPAVGGGDRGWFFPVAGILAVLASGLGIYFLTRTGSGASCWKGGWVLLAVGLIAAGSFAWGWFKGGALSEEQARGVFHGLLRNVYGAFDEREEGAVYDVLAESVSGDLLQEVYLEMNQMLILRNQGGARVKVKKVEVLEAEPYVVGEGGGVLGQRWRCRWNVSGSVGHWGHVHQRTGQYEAILGIEAVDGVWKLVGLKMVDLTGKVN